MYTFMSRLPQKDHEQRGGDSIDVQSYEPPLPQLHRNIRTMNIEQGNKGIEQKQENKLPYAYLYERLPFAFAKNYVDPSHSETVEKGT